MSAQRRGASSPLAAGALALAATLAFGVAQPEPLSGDEVAKLCAGAEGPSHCGRLIETEQLKRLPNLARREGDTLVIRLYPNGERRLVDRDTLSGGTSYSLFDYVNELNAAVLWVTQDDAIGFMLLQRTSGRETPLPAQPVLSPDRTRFATADFCATQCENQLTLWSVDREGVRRDVGWKPAERWSDATVRWKGADTLSIEYTREGEPSTRTLERRLSDPGWTRASPR